MEVEFKIPASQCLEMITYAYHYYFVLSKQFSRYIVNIRQVDNNHDKLHSGICKVWQPRSTHDIIYVIDTLTAAVWSLCDINLRLPRIRGNAGSAEMLLLIKTVSNACIIITSNRKL